MNDELQHYGVKGMKWGVRRYQNEDGSLTPRGKLRFKQVANNERVAKRQTKKAVRILRENKANSDVMSYEFEKASNKALERYNKFADKAIVKYQHTNQGKYKKGLDKADKQRDLAIEYESKKTLMDKRSSALQKKLDDISSGKLKAGRDFIVQTGINLLPVPGGLMVNTKSTLIEKKK